MHAMKCATCGLSDHWTRYCPERKVILDGKPKKVHKDDFKIVESFDIKLEKSGKYGTVYATPHEQAILLQQGVTLWETL